MQFFNLRVFYECWRSASLGRPVYEIREIRLFEASGKVFREEDELFSKVAWLQVLMGQGVVPRDYHPVADQVSRKELEEWLGEMRAKTERAVVGMPTHQQVIQDHFRAEPAS